MRGLRYVQSEELDDAAVFAQQQRTDRQTDRHTRPRCMFVFIHRNGRKNSAT